MARFHFALQPLLDARLHLEQRKRILLLGAEQTYARERSALLALRAKFEEDSRAFSVSCKQLGALDVREALVRFELVRTALLRLETKTLGAREAAAVARAEYQAASSHHRRLEAIRARRLAVFVAEQELREARETDEANAARPMIPTSSLHGAPPILP